MSELVSIRTHFERFPATVKGAFVIRGEDPNPHQVAIHVARAVAAAGADERTVEIAPVTLDVAPHVDLFVPFEFPVADLEPGWYGFECETDVDGLATTFPPTRRFCVPWPRSSVRRGSLLIAKELATSAGRVTIDHVDCGADAIKVHLVADPPEVPALRLSADGAPLPLLGGEVHGESGKGIVSAYPLLKAHASLRIEAAGKRGSIDLPLP